MGRSKKRWARDWTCAVRSTIGSLTQRCSDSNNAAMNGVQMKVCNTTAAGLAYRRRRAYRYWWLVVGDGCGGGEVMVVDSECRVQGVGEVHADYFLPTVDR